MEDSAFVTNWISRVKHGDAVAAERIWANYYSRLIALARKRLRGSSAAVADEEDIVVSVFESFYRAAENGRFPDLNSRDDLWRLLLQMAARKVVDHHRHENRLVRGGAAVTATLSDGSSDDEVLSAVGNEPSPEMVAMMTESCEQLLDHLADDQLRELAVGKMEGYSNSELAIRLDCSERTVERRLHLIRKKVTREWLVD